MPGTPRPHALLRLRPPTATLALVLLVATALACGRQIEEDPPIPEHRLEPCESWCAMLFDPACPQPVEVESEEACVEGCLRQDIVWAPIDDAHDACAATYLPFIDCMDSLSCSERNDHFARTNLVPTEEQSSCGTLLRAQLDCQSAHD